MKKLLFLPMLFFMAACVPMRAVRYLVPDLRDSARFDHVTVSRAETPFRFIYSGPNRNYGSLKQRIDTSLRGTKTDVFLVIKNDSIVYRYFSEGVGLSTRLPSFSMAKSFVGTLIGMAVEQGKIRSTHDLVIRYLPELSQNDERFRRLTIQHVLDMRSGFDFNERLFNPFSKIVRMYYGADLKKMVLKLKMKNEPNSVFEYQSINTQVLAMILEKVSGKSLAAQMQDQLWKPLGSESDALWNLDDHGNIKAFCCINATALDFAKLGRLYLKKGNWQGRQLLSTAWIRSTIDPDTLTKYRYKNQIWACRDFKYFADSASAVKSLDRDKLSYPIEKSPEGRYFYAKKVYDFKLQGMFNQSVYVNPKNNVIIVRLGGRQKKLNFHGFLQDIGRSIKN